MCGDDVDVDDDDVVVDDDDDDDNMSEEMTQCLQARALYDFDAEPGTGEVSMKMMIMMMMIMMMMTMMMMQVSIRVGEVLTITRTDVGEGWWEGSTPGGESGLFPEVRQTFP